MSYKTCLISTNWTHDWTSSFNIENPARSGHVSSQRCLYHQFSSVAQTCLTLRPHGPQQPGLPVHHQLPELAQTRVYRVGDAIQPSHPLSFCVVHVSSKLSVITRYVLKRVPTEKGLKTWKSTSKNAILPQRTSLPGRTAELLGHPGEFTQGLILNSKTLYKAQNPNDPNVSGGMRHGWDHQNHTWDGENKEEEFPSHGNDPK